VGPDAVQQVRIEHACRTVGDGFLVGTGLVITTADLARDAGPTAPVSVRAVHGAEQSGTGETGVAAPVAAEVVEVLGSEGLALPEVAAPPQLAVPAFPSGPLLARSPLCRHPGASRPGAGLGGRKIGGGGGPIGEGSEARLESGRAGGTRRTANGQTAYGARALPPARSREHTRSGRPDPQVTAPAPEGSR
jgi:hypothetical protein